jgi:hypothetical protein
VIKRNQNGEWTGTRCAPEGAACPSPKEGICTTVRVGRTRSGKDWTQCDCVPKKKEGDEEKSGTTVACFNVNQPLPVQATFAIPPGNELLDWPPSLGGPQIVPGPAGSITVLVESGKPGSLSVRIVAASVTAGPMTIGNRTTGVLHASLLPVNAQLGSVNLVSGDFIIPFAFLMSDNVTFPAGQGIECRGQVSGHVDFFSGQVVYTASARNFITVCEPFATTGFDGVCDTIAAGDDIQDIPPGQGLANAIAIEAGPDVSLDTLPGGDDQFLQSVITTGPNGISESFAVGDDVQHIAPGFGRAFAACVGAGPDGAVASAVGADDTLEAEASCGQAPCLGDANFDRTVNFGDVTAVLSAWNSFCK